MSFSARRHTRKLSESAWLRRLSALKPGHVYPLWVSNGAIPDNATIDANAGKFMCFVTNAWGYQAAQRVKQVNPGCITLCYKCLCSTRNYSGAVDNGVDAQFLPTGVGYMEASNSHPEWFATKAADGTRMEWDKAWPEHWQMTPWDPAYQLQWATNVRDEMVAYGWDGVMADNDLGTMSWYTDAFFTGYDSRELTDQKIRDGLDAMIPVAGKILNDAGLLLIPNMETARLYPARHMIRARYGGSFEEQFIHSGTSSTDGWMIDYPTGGWTDMTAIMSQPLTVAQTTIAAGDERTQRYAYASALVRTTGRTAWAYAVPYSSDPLIFAWQDIDLGDPTQAGYKDATSGIWMRRFQNGWVAANQTSQAVTVPLPGGLSQSGSVTIGPYDGALVQ